MNTLNLIHTRPSVFTRFFCSKKACMDGRFTEERAAHTNVRAARDPFSHFTYMSKQVELMKAVMSWTPDRPRALRFDCLRRSTFKTWGKKQDRPFPSKLSFVCVGRLSGVAPQNRVERQCALRFQNAG